jgi:hypothetical protein
VILYDGANPVYTTIISQNTAGFDGSNWDFQLLVPVNTAAAGTTYYFFAELV